MKTLYINFKNGEELEIKNVNEEKFLDYLEKRSNGNIICQLSYIDGYIINLIEVNYMEFIGGEE